MWSKLSSQTKKKPCEAPQTRWIGLILKPSLWASPTFLITPWARLPWCTSSSSFLHRIRKTALQASVKLRSAAGHGGIMMAWCISRHLLSGSNMPSPGALSTKIRVSEGDWSYFQGSRLRHRYSILPCLFLTITKICFLRVTCLSGFDFPSSKKPRISYLPSPRSMHF